MFFRYDTTIVQVVLFDCYLIDRVKARRNEVAHPEVRSTRSNIVKGCTEYVHAHEVVQLIEIERYLALAVNTT